MPKKSQINKYNDKINISNVRGPHPHYNHLGLCAHSILDTRGEVRNIITGASHVVLLKTNESIKQVSVLQTFIYGVC